MRLLPPCAPRLFLWTALSLVPGTVLAESRVERIEIADAESGPEIMIRSASFRASKPDFSLFRLKNPARVVIDIPGVEVAGLDTPSPRAGISAITTTQFRGRNGPVGRVVAVLDEDAEVDAQVKGDAIVITTRKGAATSPTTASTVSTPAADTPVISLQGSPDPVVTGGTLKDVVARERDGGGIVQLLTDGEVTRYEVEEVVDPPRLVIDLYGVSVTGHGERTFAATALKGARIGKHADKTRIVLETRDGVMPRYDVASTNEGIAILLSGKATAASSVVDVKGVTFDKKNGFWRLRLDTAGAVTVRTVKTSPTEKTIALDGARVADSLLGSRGLRGGSVADVALEIDLLPPASPEAKRA